MKYLLISLSFLIATSCDFSQNHEELLTGNWLAVSTTAYNSDGYRVKNGYLLEFDNGILKINHIFLDSSLTKSYTICDSLIILQDSTTLLIYQISSDSLKLIYDNESLVTFRKLPFTNSKKYRVNEDELINNSWMYFDSNYIQRMEFLKREQIYHNDATHELYTHPLKDTLYYDSYRNNSWRIFQYNNRTYFVRTFAQHYGLLHEITNLTNDTIYTKAWMGNTFRYPIIAKIDKAPMSFLQSLIATLTSKTWNIHKVVYSPGNYQEWKRKAITEWINKSAYKGEMKFDFTSDSLKIYNNDSIFIHGGWNFTNDGKYIILNDKDDVFYIEVVEISNERIVLKNSPLFSYTMNLFYYYLELEFELILK